MSKLTDAEQRELAGFVKGANRAPEPFGWDATTKCLHAAVERILTARLAAVEAERDAAQEHIARWLNENPPLSTAERVERGSTGDLATDMMRYATRLKARAEKAEAERDRLAAAVDRVEALMAGPEWHIEVALGGSHYVNDQLRAALSYTERE